MSKMEDPRRPGSFWPVSAAIHAGVAALLSAGISEPEIAPPEVPPVPIELRLSQLSAASDSPTFQRTPPSDAPPEQAEAPAPEAEFARDPLPVEEPQAPPPVASRAEPGVPVLDRPLATLARRPLPSPSAAPAAEAAPDLASVAPPSPASNPPPEYPRAARRQGLEGMVVISVRVAPDGRVLEASVASTSGHRILDEAALEGIRRWIFSPGLRAGLPSEWTVEVPVRFRLASGTARS